MTRVQVGNPGILVRFRLLRSLCRQPLYVDTADDAENSRMENVGIIVWLENAWLENLEKINTRTMGGAVA